MKQTTQSLWNIFIIYMNNACATCYMYIYTKYRIQRVSQITLYIPNYKRINLLSNLPQQYFHPCDDGYDNNNNNNGNDTLRRYAFISTYIMHFEFVNITKSTILCAIMYIYTYYQ